MKPSKIASTKKAPFNVKPPDYQPTLEELNEEFDMLGVSIAEMDRPYSGL